MGVAAEHLHHRVQFFENAQALGERVAQFLVDGLNRGAKAVAIARPMHLIAIEHQLAVAGIDLSAARALDKLVMVDAQDVIDAVIVDGHPDPTKFNELIQQRVSTNRDVQIYGEVVDILWERGQQEAMMELEALWSELLREQPITLLCGYRLGAFGHDLEAVDRICAVHEGRHPGYGALVDSINPVQAMKMLEQRAVLLELEVERRRRTEDRMHHLLDVTTELAAASDRQTVAELVNESGRVAIGASYAGVWTREGAELVLVAASNNNTRVADRFVRIPLTADFPATRAFNTGEPVFLANLGEYAEMFPDSFQRLAALNDVTYRAFALLPFDGRGVVSGVISYTFDHDHTFDESERTFTTLLARQCGVAFERIRQTEEQRALREAAEQAVAAEKASRADVELLYELIATSNRLDHVEDVYAFALRSVMRGTASDRAAILLFDNEDVMRFKASEGLSPAYCAAVEGLSPWKRTDLYPAPIAVTDIETDQSWSGHRDVMRAEGIRAIVFVPIIDAHRELIGRFMLYRNEARAFTSRDIQLIATVAVHVAQALERRRKEKELSRAYREEREARLLADEAIQAREEILSVVSHDLLNPVGLITIAASSLLNVDAGEKTVRVRTMAERIHRQAKRMARFITDLVDFAGIEGGRLELERATHHPESILTAASDLFSPIAIERGLRFETRMLQDLPAVECDSDRAVQVLTSLVSNALKVTPRGGEVSIGAEVKGDGVVFFVRDTGPGIEADELPMLFERHWRSKSSSYRGAGLALAIARGIVDAHGGKIWAESHVGAGSTFYFSLTAPGTERVQTPVHSLERPISG